MTPSALQGSKTGWSMTVLSVLPGRHDQYGTIKDDVTELAREITGDVESSLGM